MTAITILDQDDQACGGLRSVFQAVFFNRLFQKQEMTFHQLYQKMMKIYTANDYKEDTSLQVLHSYIVKKLENNFGQDVPKKDSVFATLLEQYLDYSF